MTSLRELAGGRPIDREALLDGCLARLEPRYEALRAGRFDAGAWSARQATTGTDVASRSAGGRPALVGRASGVDPETGALLRRGSTVASRSVDAGEVTAAGWLADRGRPGGPGRV